MTYASAIEACSRMISGRAANSGAARRISAPLLNIVLGAGAEECLETIRQSYQDCWSAAADQLCWLKTEDCMDEAGFENRVGDAFYTMRSNPGAFGSNSTLRMAYFWDVMDDRFPELFQAVQHQPDFGQAVTVAEYYFLFVRQVFNSDRERIGRLRAVVDWAERNGKHLIVQSDLTNGNVSGSGPEGYQAAANVMVIVNSQDDNRLGQGLEAAIWGAGSSAVWSLSADRKVKETDEIACAAMEQILTECLEQAGAAGGQSNIQETLCGAQRDYDSLFREYIDEKELLPDLPTFLQYLPYTKEMEALEQSLSDAPTPWTPGKTPRPTVGYDRRGQADKRGGVCRGYLGSLREPVLWTVCAGAEGKCGTGAGVFQAASVQPRFLRRDERHIAAGGRQSGDPHGLARAHEHEKGNACRVSASLCMQPGSARGVRLPGGAALRSYEGCMQKCEGLRKHTDGDPERAAAIPGER